VRRKGRESNTARFRRNQSLPRRSPAGYLKWGVRNTSLGAVITQIVDLNLNLPSSAATHAEMETSNSASGRFLDWSHSRFNADRWVARRPSFKRVAIPCGQGLFDFLESRSLRQTLVERPPSLSCNSIVRDSSPPAQSIPDSCRL